MRAPALPAGIRRRVGSSARLAQAAGDRLRNQLVAGSFAARAGDNGLLPNGAVALFFATGPDNLYQFEQWRRPLERLAEQRPAFVITDRPDTGDHLLKSSSLPLAFARGSAALEELVAERDIRVVLYVNQVEANFRMLRFPGPVHIQIGHGESDKAGSSSHQHLAYDRTFVGGAAGSERLGAALREFDAETRTVQIGRPQLDHDYPGAPDWAPDSGPRVLYAPTWEGDRPSIAYGSLVSHGVALVEALLSDPEIRVIYRPHPRTGRASVEHASADREIRRLLAADGPRHLVDEGADYGWQWAFADACVTDVSAVAYDWLATGKPLLVTEPDRRAYRPPSALLERLRSLAPGESSQVLDRLEDQGLGSDRPPSPDLVELAHHYFGDTEGAASSRRFAAAIDTAYALGAGHDR